MNALKHVPPPVRAPHKIVPLTGEPIEATITPIEGEPLFVAVGQRAANEYDFGPDGQSQGNLPMLLAAIAYILVIAATLAVSGFFLLNHFDNPVVRMVASGVAVIALSLWLLDRISERVINDSLRGRA